MSSISLILSALLSLTLVAVLAPNILAMNHGKILRNIALWLATFLALALLYQTFGPGSKHPMFNTPAALSSQNLAPPKN